MKKVFMTLAVAGMICMVSCGKDDKKADTNTTTEETTVVEDTVVEETVVEETSDSESAAKDLEAEWAAEGYTVNKDGDLVDAAGKVIKSYSELVAEYGNSVLGQAFEFAGMSVSDLSNLSGMADIAASLGGTALDVAADYVSSGVVGDVKDAADFVKAEKQMYDVYKSASEGDFEMPDLDF